MVRKQHSYKIVMSFFAAGLLSTSAQAAQEPLKPFNLNAKYTVAWNGITIGRIRLHATETPNSYSLSVDTKTHGIGAMFSNEKRITTAEGKRHPDGGYLTTRYESQPMDETEGRRTSMTYDPEGNIDKVTRIPQEDPNWRPEVQRTDINTARDSATAGLVLRQQLYAALGENGNAVHTRTFDGARLAEMYITAVKPEARVQIMDNYVPAVNTIVTRKPIAGYTPKELKKYNAGDPQIRLYFSADAKFIPLLATVDTGFGQLSATLSKIE